MTKVDFYILPDTTLEARLNFACRLAETIYRKGYQLHIHTQDESMARELDELLWTFREDSYVPHRVAGDAMDPPPPVTIGWEAVPEPGVQAMLNLNDEIPEWFSRLERVAEIINQHQDVLRTKRACWKTYKDRGYRVEAHKL